MTLRGILIHYRIRTSKALNQYPKGGQTALSCRIRGRSSLCGLQRVYEGKPTSVYWALWTELMAHVIDWVCRNLSIKAFTAVTKSSIGPFPAICRSRHPKSILYLLTCVFYKILGKE